MTSSENSEQYVDFMIERFNRLRYDEDGEVVRSAEEVVSMDHEFFSRFDDVKWEIADRIGCDYCRVYDEGEGFIVYEIESGDYGVEYVQIRLGEKCSANVAFYSSLEMLE